MPSLGLTRSSMSARRRPCTPNPSAGLTRTGRVASWSRSRPRAPTSTGARVCSTCLTRRSSSVTLTCFARLRGDVRRLPDGRVHGCGVRQGSCGRRRAATRGGRRRPARRRLPDRGAARVRDGPLGPAGARADFGALHPLRRTRPGLDRAYELRGSLHPPHPAGRGRNDDLRAPRRRLVQLQGDDGRHILGYSRCLQRLPIVPYTASTHRGGRPRCSKAAMTCSAQRLSRASRRCGPGPCHGLRRLSSPA